MFDTSVATQNMGDYIINEAIDREMSPILCNDYIVRYPTHTPVRKFYQRIRPDRFSQEAELKFLCGTNIFGTSLLHPVPNFNINIFDTDIYSGCISLGCGIGRDHPNSDFNYYTKLIYKRILSKRYVHAVRDEKTKLFLNTLGFDAVNTGCPTLWMLNEKHCSMIPKNKSDSVIFTLTDYCRDVVLDRQLISILRANYKHLFFWIQGSTDLTYINSISDGGDINLVYPSLQNYKQLLLDNDIDYIGTRLHAGIYAMQHFRRSIILIVDNRAKDMSDTHNLPVINRRDLYKLDNLINSEFETKVTIEEKVINEWKSQF